MTIKNQAGIARLYQDNMLSNRDVQVKNSYQAGFQKLLDHTLGNETDRLR